MRYNELDLNKLLPHGVPLNESSSVVSRRAINAFFLRAFEAWYSQMQSMAVSSQAPYSLDACMACTDEELRRFIEERGIEYYPSNSHDVNAKFACWLALLPFGTEAYIDAIIKYICNTTDVSGYSKSRGGFLYDVHIQGDLTLAELTETYINRLYANLRELVPAGASLNGIVAEDDTTVSTYTGGIITLGAHAESSVLPSSTYRGYFKIDRTDKELSANSNIRVLAYNYLSSADYSHNTSTTRSVLLLGVYRADGTQIESTVYYKSTMAASMNYALIFNTGSDPGTAAYLIYQLA